MNEEDKACSSSNFLAQTPATKNLTMTNFEDQNNVYQMMQQNMPEAQNLRNAHQNEHLLSSPRSFDP